MKISLSVIEGPHQGKSFEFAEHDTFVVGRAKYAHFQLPPDDPYFSRAHFLVEVNPPNCRLLDLASSNGTFVNGQRVAEADLKDGDTIAAGDTILKLQLITDSPTEHTDEVKGEPGPPGTIWHTRYREPADASGKRKPSPARVNRPRLKQDDALRQADTVAPADSPLSQADFEIVKELGRGGMGVVYLARKRDSGREVALKTIIPAGQPLQRDLKQFLREASILRQLRHPNIVAYHDSGDSDGTLFMTMEYVPGENAQQLLARRGPLSLKGVLRIASQLLMAIDYAHAKGFVHRDIKPANLLLQKTTQGSHVKLSDFGLAKVYQASKLSGMTMHGEMGGSFGFMAPEQVTNYRSATPAADIYAAAATLYTLLTGKLIHDFPDKLAERVLVMLQGEPIRIEKRLPGIPAAIADALHSGLRRDPRKRHQSAQEFAKALGVME